MKHTRLQSPRRSTRSPRSAVRTGSRRAPLLACASVLVAAAFNSTAPATSYFWDSLTKNWSDGDGQDWLTSFGGSPVAAPVSDPGNLLFFGDTTQFTSTDDLGDGFQLNGITLSNTNVAADSITGNSLSFISNGVVTPTLTQSGTGPVSIANGIVMTNGLTLGGSGSGVTTLSGVISGATPLTVSGANWLANNGANSWSGGTLLTGGKLELTNPATNGNFDLLAAGNSMLGAGGSVTINGGTLRITTNGTGLFNAGVTTAAAGRVYTFGTAGGTLDINAILGGSGGVNGGISVALPTNVAQLNAPAVIKFNGGTQGFDGSTTQVSWNNGPNSLHFTNNASGLTGLNINNPVRIEITNGATFALDNPLPNGANPIASPFTFAGIIGGDPSAFGTEKTAGRIAVLSNTSYNFANGLNFDAGALQIQGGGGARTLIGPINFLTGANVGLTGRATGATITSPETSALILGTSTAINANTITINSGATAAMDIRLRTDQIFAHGMIVFDKTNILAGGTLKFTQSSASTTATNTVGWIDMRGDIVGNGTSPGNDSIVDLRLGVATSTGTVYAITNGVTFNNPGTAGSDLIVNGTGFGGLKVVGSGRTIKTSATAFLVGGTGPADPLGNDLKVSNLLTAPRLAALTGSGGYLTPAATGVVWNFPAGGEWVGGVSVGLKVTDSNSGGADVSFSGIPSFSHNVAVEAGATLDTGATAFTFNSPAVIAGKGTISGAGGITVASGAKVAPGLGDLGTLTVGDITLNGTLEIDTLSTPGSQSDLLNTGTLTLGGTSILSLPGTFTNGLPDYTITNYSTLVGSAFGTITGLPAGYTILYGTGINDSIKLHFGAIVINIWNGNLNGNWDIGTDANWQAPNTTYADGNFVQFDNTASGPNLDVVITGGNVSPGAILVNNDTSHNYSITGTPGNAIVGTATLTKNGTGKLTLSGPNTYGGGTKVNGGTLELGSNNALPSTGTVAVGAAGTLDIKTFNNTLADVTVAGAVNGTGTLTVNSLTLTNSPTFNPNLVLNGSLTKSGTGSATLPGTVDLGAATQTVSVATGTAPELTLSGVVSDGGISKAGNGVLLLGNAANTFTGGLAITAGTVRLGATGALPSANALTIGATGTLDANGNAVAVSSLSGVAGATISLGTQNLTVTQSTGITTYAGAISGTTASVTKAGNGELDLTGSSNFTGGLTVNGGSVRLGTINSAGTPASSTITVNTGGTVSLITGAVTFANPFALAGGTLGNTTSATAVTLSGSVTASTGTTTTLDAFDPITLANGVNGQDLLFTGQLHGSGNLLVTAIPGNPRDSNGVRLRETVSDFSGNVEVQPAGKFELQSAVANFSPLGTGSVTLDAGTFTNNTTGGTFPIINLRNTSSPLVSINLGNAVKVTGTGSVLFNMLGPANVTMTMGALDVGGVGLTQTLDAAAAAVANVETLAFGAVTAHGGTVTFSAGIPGNTNYLAPENISLGAITESAQTNIAVAGLNPATVTLTAGSSHTGTTAVTSGTLVVSGALSGTSGLTVGGGTVKFTGADLINHAATATLMDGGVFNTGGFSETLGALTLTVATVTAKIDLGTGASVLQFADSSAAPWTGSLEIDDWSGSQTGGGTDELLFGSTASGLTGGQLADITFLNPDGFAAGSYSAAILPSGEIVPTPEPSSLAAVISGFGMLLGLQRFRRRS